MPLAAKRFLSFVSLSLLCLFLAPGVGATVFRDRAAFEAAAQNLHTLDFESVGRFGYWRGDTIDGLHFGVQGFGGHISTRPGVPGKVLVSIRTCVGIDSGVDNSAVAALHNYSTFGGEECDLCTQY